jgi:hypothetical protein
MTGNAWRILVTACDSPASWFTTHPQLFNIRVDPTNSSRNVLVPWGPDPDNEFPQCVTSCRSSSDLPCAATGFYPAFPGDDARTLLSDQCETITLKDLDPAVQAAAADTWENIELLPVSGPPTPPAPPPLPPIPPPSPPAPPSFSCPNPTTGVLARHNSKRALHTDTPALTWNATLVATAEAQAKLCVWDYASEASLIWWRCCSAANFGAICDSHQGCCIDMAAGSSARGYQRATCAANPASKLPWLPGCLIQAHHCPCSICRRGRELVCSWRLPCRCLLVSS